MANYFTYVKGKNAEEILASADADYPGPVGEYLRVAAQVRSTQELVASLTTASTDSGKLGTKLLFLTGALILVGILQAIATEWPYLAWWWHHSS